MYKEAEELRASLGMTQIEFAKAIGMSIRNYQERLDGKRPKWTIAEISKLAQLGEGKIRIVYQGKKYDIDLSCVE